MELALYFLIIKIGYGMVVMPEKYPIDQCEKISKGFEQGQAYCVVGPQTVPVQIKTIQRCEKIDNYTTRCY